MAPQDQNVYNIYFFGMASTTDQITKKKTFPYSIQPSWISLRLGSLPTASGHKSFLQHDSDAFFIPLLVSTNYQVHFKHTISMQ